MPRRAPSGGRFAQPCVDPALPLCDINSLWTLLLEFINGFGAGYGDTEDVKALFRELGAAPQSRALWAFDEPGWVEKARALAVGTVATRSPALFPDACPGGA